MIRFVPVVLLALAALAAGPGCAVGPDYQRPAAPVPPRFKEAAPGWRAARPTDESPRGAWWDVFGDARLSALERKIELNNQTLKAAEAQFVQARALLRYARAGYFPSVTGGISAALNRQSQNRALFVSTSKITYADIVIPVDVSYEVDVWGRVRRTVEAAGADTQASAADLEAVRLTLHAELALDYLVLSTIDSEQRLLDSTVISLEQSLQLTQNRHVGGIASSVDVAQAEAQLEATRAQAIDVRIARAQAEHAIATLLGRPASTFSLPVSAAPPAPPPIPVGLPSALLERRPDVAAAERRMAAANARIGVARAAYFPTISLGLAGGFESGSFSNLISAPSGLFAIGISALATIFDGGRRRALNEQAGAAYDQTVASYRQTVLGAIAEAEDNLAALAILEQEARSQDAAVTAAARALALSVNRYKGGVTTYLEVLTAQGIALANQRAAVDVLRRRLSASVLLIKALGGGWAAGDAVTSGS